MLVAAFQSLSPSTQQSEIDLDYFDKKTAKKEAKKLAKTQAKAAAEEEAYNRKLENDARKLAAKKEKQVEDKARKAAAKAAAEKEAKQTEAATAKTEGGGKKKKKKNKKGAAKAATAVEPVAAKTEEAAEEAVKDDWTVAVDKFAVRKAKKSALAAELGPIEVGPTSSTVTMNVDKKHYKLIIGAGSKNITTLQTMFTCKIQLPNKNSSDDTVTISGQNNEQLALCKEAISQLVEKGYCKALSGDVTDVSMTVSNIGLLIGPGGKNVGTIREKTKIEINLPPREDRNKNEKSKDATVTLIGDLVGIQAAMNAINQLMLQGFCDLTHPDWVKISLAFPGSMLGILLGPKGSNLRTIETETETTVKVPNNKSEEDKARLVNISIIGAIANVEKARARIAAIQTDFVKKEVDFPTSLLASLIGNKGESIRKLQSENSVRINIEEHVWDPDLRSISIEGFEKDSAIVIAAIEHIVATHTRSKVEFPTSRIGILIGKSGSTVNKIKDDHKVHINVANHEWDESVRVVSVDGLTDNVEAAIAKIEILKIPAPKKTKPKKADSGDEGEPAEEADGETKPKRERRERRERQGEEATTEETPAETNATAE